MYWFCLCLLYLCMWYVSTFLFLFLKTSKLKVTSFPQQKTRKSICSSSCLFALHIFLFSLPDALLSQSCFLQFGDARSKLVWMNSLLFSFFIITKFLCVFNSFPAIFFFLFRVFFYTHNFSILYEFNPFVFYIKIILYHKLKCAIIIRYRMGVQYSKREGCKVWK